MEFKDYYAALGLERTATPAEIKRAFRKLARQYHPDVSKEADAEARFKEVAEAHEVLHHTERRAAYDALLDERKNGQAFKPPPSWSDGFEFNGSDPDHSAFFEQLFGRRPSRSPARPGEDHHARVEIDVEDSYRGGLRSIALRVPVADANGDLRLQLRQLDVNIPKGLRAGQHLRLTGQGGSGLAGSKAGDLYLEVEFAPHPRYRVEERDVYMDLALAPWEAALGCTVEVGTPEGGVHLNVPPGSTAGRKLRLKGRGIPGSPPGDLYVLLAVSLPPATTPPAQDAYRRLAESFPDFSPRPPLETPAP